METKTYSDPLQCNLKLSGSTRQALIDRLTAVGRVDYTSFARELLETQLLNSAPPEHGAPGEQQTKDFAEPLQCNLKLTGALRDAVIQRLIEAGRTDHTTFVREILEGILVKQDQDDSVIAPVGNEATPERSEDRTQEINDLVERATNKINSVVSAAEQKLAALTAELRHEFAEKAKTDPAPHDSEQMASFFQSARETLDAVLTQSTAKIAQLEEALRNAIEQAQSVPEPTEAAMGEKTIESVINEARTKFQEDVTKKIEALENEVREAVRGMSAQADHSAEVSNFLRTSRETLDSVLTESVEKVLSLDKDLRAQIAQLNQLKEGAEQDHAHAKKLLSDLSARPEPQAPDFAELKRRQDAIEMKLGELDYTASKLAEDFVAYRDKAPVQVAHKENSNLASLIFASLSLIGVAALAVIVWLKPPPPAATAPNLSGIEASITALTKRIDEDELTFAKELSQIQRDIKALQNGEPRRTDSVQEVTPK